MKFPSGRSRLRRDHGKYLALIRTITLLHQFQRERKFRDSPKGKEEYIEVTKADLDLAHKIAVSVFTRTLDEMPPHTRTFLELITKLRDSESDKLEIEPQLVRLTKRQMMEATGLSATQTFHHLTKLMELEYIIQFGIGVGKPSKYEVLDSLNPGFFQTEETE